jgi:hypothetical protein
MTAPEKKISFLNRYFVYKKIRTVNIENVELELGEYQENVATINNIIETKEAQEVAIDEVKKLQPKVRKLSKKLLLVAATEAVDDLPVYDKTPAKKPRSKKVKNEPKAIQKTTLIIEEDDDDE